MEDRRFFKVMEKKVVYIKNKPYTIIELLIAIGVCKSRAESKRLVLSGLVLLNYELVKNENIFDSLNPPTFDIDGYKVITRNIEYTIGLED